MFFSFKYTLLLIVQFHQSSDFFVSCRILEKCRYINVVFKTLGWPMSVLKFGKRRMRKISTVLSAIVCWKSFSIGNGGIENLKQHAKGKKHKASSWSNHQFR